MRWFKKIVRAVLALLPAFILSMCITNPSYATRHDYDGLFISDKLIVPRAVNGALPNSYSDRRFVDNQLRLSFDDSVYEFRDVNPYLNNFFFTISNVFGGQYSSNGGFSDDVSSHCIYNFSNVLHNFIGLSTSSGHTSLSLSGSSYDFDGYSYSGSNGLSCSNFDFQSSHSVQLYSGYDKMYLQNPDGTLVETPTSSISVVSPYSSTYNGLKLHKTEVSDSDGLTYSHSFSFSRLFDGDQPNKFEYLRIPLSSKDGYFIDSSNLSSGREFQFKLLFKFDGSFAWNADVSQGYSRILAYTIDSSDSLSEKTYSCTNNLVQVSGHTQLEISCPITLDKNYLAFIPVFEIYNPGYVWDSSSWWEFYGFYLITDNDDTPGSRFNSDLYGDVWSPSDGVGGDGSCNDSDIACKLNNLFIFSIPVSNTPLGGILGNFSDQSQCIPIPVIAGMLNSNETQVCPWFSSSVRAISTPILSMFSVCLLFGFVVRWLKSSSGDNMLNLHKNGDRD